MSKLAKLGAMLTLATFLLAADSPPASRPANAAAQADIKSLQGTWRIVRAENKGQDVREKLGYEQFTVEGSTMRMVRNGEERKTSFEIDPAHDPKWITFTPASGKKIEGIYDLKGDTWRTVSSARGRPAKFEDQGTILFVYERGGGNGTATKPTTKPVPPR